MDYKFAMAAASKELLEDWYQVARQ